MTTIYRIETWGSDGRYLSTQHGTTTRHELAHYLRTLRSRGFRILQEDLKDDRCRGYVGFLVRRNGR